LVVSDLRRRRQGPQGLQEGAHPVAGGAVGHLCVRRLVVVGGGRYVQVCPPRARRDEVGQEQGRLHGVAVAVGAVDPVGHRRAQMAPLVGQQRQPYQGFPGAVGGLCQQGGEPVVRGEQGGRTGAQRVDGGRGEGGHVDDETAVLGAACPQ